MPEGEVGVGVEIGPDAGVGVAVGPDVVPQAPRITARTRIRTPKKAVLRTSTPSLARYYHVQRGEAKPHFWWPVWGSPRLNKRNLYCGIRDS